MQGQSASFNTGLTTISACPPLGPNAAPVCAQCPFPGSPGTKQAWDAARAEEMMGPKQEGGVLKQVTDGLSLFDNGAGMLKRDLKGIGANIRKISDEVSKNGKQ